MWISELAIDFIGIKFGFEYWQYMMTDANKLPVFFMAVSMFLFFKNIRVKYHKAINIFAASTFGVFLIHANSKTMMQWLWKDFLHNIDYFTSTNLWFHMFLSVIAIHIACTVIDICRIRFVEVPIFSLLDKRRI